MLTKFIHKSSFSTKLKIIQDTFLKELLQFLKEIDPINLWKCNTKLIHVLQLVYLLCCIISCNLSKNYAFSFKNAQIVTKKHTEHSVINHDIW